MKIPCLRAGDFFYSIVMTQIAELQEIETLKFVTGKELDFLKANPTVLFPEELFPFKSDHPKPVWIRLGKDIIGKPEIEFGHRNRTGRIIIDNGYWGPRPDNRNYYVIVKVDPWFTNECGYSPRVEPKIFDEFNKDMLKNLADQTVKLWDKAIENNARLWGS